jgi:hypothetical protein
MNEQATAEVTAERTQPTEELTVLPVAGDVCLFYVLGSERQGERTWYEVSLGDDTHLPRCECPHHTYRLAGTNRLCKHLAAAREFVERGKRAAADTAVSWFLSLSEEEKRGLFR